MRVLSSGASRAALCAAAIVAAAGVGAPVLAEPAATVPAVPAERQKADRQTELRGVEDTIRASEEQRRAIEAEIDSIRTDQERLMEAMIATTARVQEAWGQEGTTITIGHTSVTLAYSRFWRPPPHA